EAIEDLIGRIDTRLGDEVPEVSDTFWELHRAAAPAAATPGSSDPRPAASWRAPPAVRGARTGARRSRRHRWRGPGGVPFRYRGRPGPCRAPPPAGASSR